MRTTKTQKLVLFLSLVSSGLCACSSFHPYAKQTKIGSKDGYTQVFNTKAMLTTSTYGDFKFATDRRAYKKLTGKSPEFKSILFYAQTEKPSYEYYLLINPEEKIFDGLKFDIKDTMIHNDRFVLLISKNAPQSDRTFILNHLDNLKSDN